MRCRKISIGWGNTLKRQDAKKIGYTILKGGAQILAAVAFLLCVWQIGYWAADNELVVPALPDCLAAALDLLADGWFWRCFGTTFLRVLFAFCFSFVSATVFAVIAYLLPWFARFLTPIVAALRSLPVLAVTLILLKVFGASGASVAVAFMSLFPSLYTGILAALSGIDKQLIDVGSVYGATVKNRVFRVYLPLSAPYILREAAGAFSFALKLVVSAEVVANAAKSLGGMMQDARIWGELPTLFALVVVTFVAALILELIGNAVAACMDKRIK